MSLLSLTEEQLIQYFNTRGLLSQLRDPEQNNTYWTYDGAGRVKVETNALTRTRNYTYDAASRLTERIDRLGRKIVYEYDAAGRNTAEKWYAPNTNDLVRTISFSYDAAGRLKSFTPSKVMA